MPDASDKKRIKERCDYCDEMHWNDQTCPYRSSAPRTEEKDDGKDALELDDLLRLEGVAENQSLRRLGVALCAVQLLNVTADRTKADAVATDATAKSEMLKWDRFKAILELVHGAMVRVRATCMGSAREQEVRTCV